MTAYDPRLVRRVPGRLAYGCTNLASVWPHGGTGLGLVRGVVYREYGADYPVTVEAKGGAPVEYLRRGVIVGIGGILRGWDDDALSLLFPNTAAGTTSQRRVVGGTETVRAGNWMSGSGVVLVFTPEGATHAQSASTADVDAPFIVLHRAIPMLGETAELKLNRRDDTGMPVLFMGIENTNGKTRMIGPRRDLSLT